MIRTALVLIACLIVGTRLTYAKPIEEKAFWLLLEQTERLLAQPQPNLDMLRQQWAEIDSVQLNSVTITLDLAWIKDALASGNDEQVQRLRRSASALLKYHAQQTNLPMDGGASLTALDQVLRDPRFEYQQIVPTPLPTSAAPSSPNSNEPVSSGASSLPSQLVLIALGILVVIAVLSYLARSINVQSAELNAASGEDPTNFAEAHERAQNYEAVQNYRAAIRYLYLSSLLLLDEHNLIRYDPSLTNHEHLRQIAAKPQLFEALRQVINTFEDVWYGFQPIDDASYQAYRRHIDHLRQLIS